jgi:hypothetical protein
MQVSSAFSGFTSAEQTCDDLSKVFRVVLHCGAHFHLCADFEVGVHARFEFVCLLNRMVEDALRVAIDDVNAERES